MLKISVQRILLAVCERAAETTNSYERHRILLMYHLFVNLLLREVKDGLGGAWAFVLRDIIYTLIHHINRLVQSHTHTHTPNHPRTPDPESVSNPQTGSDRRGFLQKPLAVLRPVDLCLPGSAAVLRRRP